MIGGRALAGAAILAVAAAQAQVDWKREFEEVCAKTQDAMGLSTDELRGLVERCDKLAPLIDTLEESARKVYSRRLKACRDLYAFVLETRGKEQVR